MALTLRTNGVAGGLVTSSWWNDYYNLLTGAMSDQPITIANGVSLGSVSSSALVAPTLALVSGTALGIGAYTYGLGFVMGNGRTIVGPTANITTTTGNQAVTVSGIPVGPAGTTARIVWRSKVGTSSPFFQAVFIGDNTTTSTTDTTPDASLTTAAPTHDSFGGYLQVRNAAGTRTFTLYNDGSLWTDTGAFQTDGAGNIIATSMKLTPGGTVLSGTSGTATLYQAERGTYKRVVILLNGFQNTSGSVKTMSIPVPFTSFVSIRTFAGHQFALNVAGVAQTLNILTGLALAGGPTSTQAFASGNSFGWVQAAVDGVGFNSGGSSPVNSMLIIEGF